MVTEAELLRQLYKGLRAAVTAGGGAVAIGMEIGGKAEPDDAEQWVNDRLNPNRRERFSLLDIVRILNRAREAGCHDAYNAFTLACGYPQPRIFNAKDRPMPAGDAIVPTLLAQMLDEMREQNRKLDSLPSIEGAALSMDATLTRFADKYA